jgi:hypothetical protein
MTARERIAIADRVFYARPRPPRPITLEELRARVQHRQRQEAAQKAEQE